MNKELNETINKIKKLENKYSEKDILGWGNILRALNFNKFQYILNPSGYMYKNGHIILSKIDINKNLKEQSIDIIININNEFKNIN